MGHAQTIIATMAKLFSALDTGFTSPYPTVVIVVNDLAAIHEVRAIEARDAELLLTSRAQ